MEVKSKPIILFLAYWHGKGLAYTLTHQAIALKEKADRAGFDFYVASTSQELEPGLWDLLRSTISSDHLFELRDEDESLRSLVLDLLSHSDQPLIVDMHGIRQLKKLKKIKRDYGDRLKFLYEVHSYQNTSWKRRVYAAIATRLMRRWVDYVLFPSPNAAHDLLYSKKLFVGGKAGFVPEGLEVWDTELTKPSLNIISQDLVEIAEDKTLFKFLFIAHFKNGKGHEWLLNAIAPILKRYPRVRLILPGDGYNTGIMDRVVNLAQRHDVLSQVVLPGHYPNRSIPWLAANCDVGLVPSSSETFGRNYIEPMISGLPVIGTRKGAGEWLIMDFYTGIGFDYGDTEALRRAAEYVVKYPQRARKMGENAKSLCQSLLRWDRSADTIVGIYQFLLDDIVECKC